MPDQKAGSWAVIGGIEIANSQRTIDYIHNFGLPIKVDADCWCPGIQELLGPDCGPVTGYGFPSTDPAPWYDPTEPESGDFLGFLTTEFDGLGSTFTRNSFETLQGGAILGRLRPQARTMTWKGYLFGRTCCAAEYGLRYLTSVLASAGGCGDGCDGAELDILLCCPAPTGLTNKLPACQQHEVNSCSTNKNIGLSPPVGASLRNDDAFRKFYHTGLIDGPKILSQRTLGCGGDCEDGPGCLIEAEFSIIAGNPYMHRETKQVCKMPFPPCDASCDPNDPVWVKLGTTAYPASTADGTACLDSLDCDVLDTSVNCILDPDCPTASLPVFPPFEDACGCEAFWTTRFCCSIDNREPVDPNTGAQSAYGKFFEGVPTVTVYSGSQKLKNVTINFYENPQQRTCTDTQVFASDCFKCASMNIRYIPPNTTFVLDGLTKRVTAECPGRDPIAAESNTVSPFAWPVLKCISYLITVEADCSFGVAPDATVCVSITPREM